MLNSDVVYYDFDNFRLDLEKQQLLKNGEPVLLTHKAFQTLHILVQNCGQIVEKENIYNSIWADSFVEEGNLTQYIYLLRKTLDKNPDGESYIETIARRGYVFTAQVEKIFGPADPAARRRQFGSSNSNISVSDAPNISAEPNTSQSWLFRNEPLEFPESIDRSEPPQTDKASWKTDPLRRRLRRLPAAIASLLIIAASIALFDYFDVGKPAPAGGPRVASLAVLPFQPVGDESRDSKLGFGMADAIITRLSNLQKIPVRPSSSVFRYIDEPPASYASAGADLGVEAILEGTVQRDGDRVRISVQLFNVADGKAIWAEKFDEKYTDVFSLQDSIASRVVSSLDFKLTPQQWKVLEKHQTGSTEALEAYQMGVYFWNTRTKEDLQRAEANFQKAIEIDPKFARSFAMLSDTYNMLGYYRFADRTETNIKATVAAAKALELDDTVAEAHIAMAFIQFSPAGFDSAWKSIERAIELAPYNSTARLRHAWILMRMSKLDEAVAEMRLAREYDPLSPVSNGALCNILTYRENFGEAVEVCKRAVELAPDTADNRLAYANALFFNGNTAEAIELAKIAVEKSERKFSALGNVGFYYAKLGRRAEAEVILAQIKPESEKDPGLLVDLVLIEYALGNRDRSFAYFLRAYEKRVVSMNLFNNDPVWKEVRADSRFAKVMAE
ncbi:MAG: winged helix-turn-helix domain-containing protein [Saprospiraceae bacterium]|nr:winged helix-turn-helix domain-containing protein [Pyrinomonadaceae bacterium]